MPWLYLLVLSIVVLVVWWALSRSAETKIAPDEDHPEVESREEKTSSIDDEKTDDPVR